MVMMNVWKSTVVSFRLTENFTLPRAAQRETGRRFFSGVVRDSLVRRGRARSQTYCGLCDRPTGVDIPAKWSCGLAFEVEQTRWTSLEGLHTLWNDLSLFDLFNDLNASEGCPVTASRLGWAIFRGDGNKRCPGWVRTVSVLPRVIGHTISGL